jgi:ribosomal protein L7Ae-like RNA K-turn-binding protein
VFGFDAVTEAMKKGKAAGVLTTSDISPKTLKEIRFHAEKYNTSVFEIPASMEETGVLLGKKAGVLAVTDEKLLNILNLGGK